MKRQQRYTSKNINFQRENSEKQIFKENVHEVNSLLKKIYEKDDTMDITINANTKHCEISIKEKSHKFYNDRKYKYKNSGLKNLLDAMYDEFMFKDINTLIISVNDNNIFAEKQKWTEQLYNEILYINILEKEQKGEHDLIKTLKQLEV